MLPPETLALIRELLSQTPSPETFTQLCELLGDDPVEDHIIEYIKEHIAHWPYQMSRVAPIKWLWLHSTASPMPQLALCNNHISADEWWPMGHIDQSHPYAAMYRRKTTEFSANTRSDGESDTDDIPF